MLFVRARACLVNCCVPAFRAPSPDDTPWEDGTFRLQLEFTEDYPNKAPTVKFVTKLFHPNVYADGSICLDILQNQVGSPALAPARASGLAFCVRPSWARLPGACVQPPRARQGSGWAGTPRGNHRATPRTQAHTPLPSLPPFTPALRSARAVVSDLRHLGHPHLDPVAALRPEPQLARELGGCSPLPGAQGREAVGERHRLRARCAPVGCALLAPAVRYWSRPCARALIRASGHLCAALPTALCAAQENRREYERKVKEIVEQSWAAEAAE